MVKGQNLYILGKGVRTNSARSSWVRALSGARHHLQQPASRHDVLAGRAAGRTAPHPRQRHLQTGFPGRLAVLMYQPNPDASTSPWRARPLDAQRRTHAGSYTMTEHVEGCQGIDTGGTGMRRVPSSLEDPFHMSSTDG